ncbi:hypothetical protein J6590_108454 [Homalodisca vitripennis]|nr:hypothetical protein J6590_108454 [Homalodisca vitripennis]
MKAEADADRFLIDVKKVNARVSAATGVSERTVTRIKSERKKVEESGTSFETPNKNRILPKRVTGLDDFNLGVVRRIVDNFYLIEKQLPTLKGIQEKMRSDINFTGSKSSVSRILRRMGYKWRKTKTNKKILMETQDISYKRFVFLKKISQYRAEQRAIIYTDESYIDSTHVSKKGWSDDSTAGLAVPLSKGNRLIFLHAGGEMGFIKDCLVMWQANHRKGDYHDNMNHENYKKWLTEKLIPNLPPRSVLIIDNASYHNVEIDKSPTSNSRKCDMQAWLLEKNIPYSHTMLKVELYEIIKANKPAYKRYVIDELLGEKGHVVLRLPPYHPELNAIEFIWAEVKNWVGAHNVRFKMDEVNKLVNDKFESITVDTWKKYVNM